MGFLRSHYGFLKMVSADGWTERTEASGEIYRPTSELLGALVLEANGSVSGQVGDNSQYLKKTEGDQRPVLFSNP